MHCRYSTGQGVSGSDARFQMYYETQCQNPVSLLEASRCSCTSLNADLCCCSCLLRVCCVTTELHMQVHLRVDTTLTNNKLDVVAYVARHLTLGDRSTSLAQEFQQVPCEVRTVEVERLGSECVRHHFQARCSVYGVSACMLHWCSRPGS